VDGLPYGYTDDELQAAIDNPANQQIYGDTTYWLLPAKGTLPLLRPFEDLAASAGLTPFVKPLISLFNPLLTELVNLGYDRSLNRGIPTWASPLPFNPFQNWVEVGLRLVVAAVKGIQAFVADLGGPTAAVAPAPEPVSTLALATAADTETLDATAKVAEEAPKLELVKDDSETTAQELDAVVEEETATEETSTGVEDETTTEVEGETSTEVEDETTPSTEEEPAVTKPEDETESDPSETPVSSVDEDDEKDAVKEDAADPVKEDAADDVKTAADDVKKDDTKDDADSEKAAA
jgi:PE-PPE domain-containing protein